VSESATQRAILDYLEAIPSIYVWRNNTGVARTGGRHVRYGHVGSGDILGVLPGGRMLSIEVKAKDGNLSREQREFAVRMLELGAVCFTARSVDDVVVQMRLLGVVP
jgi:hypothetical protein